MRQHPVSAHVQSLVGRPSGWPFMSREVEVRHLRRATAVLRRRLEEHAASARCDPFTGRPCPFVEREHTALMAVLHDLVDLGELGDTSSSTETLDEEAKE
jgi:hypothetical protein